MPDYTRHQKKIIERYYDRRDDIMLAKLGELVTELYLTTDPTRLDRLWDRVATAMRHLKVNEGLTARLLAKRDVKALAEHVRDWSGPARP